MRKILYLITIILTLSFGLAAQSGDFNSFIEAMQDENVAKDTNLTEFIDQTALNDSKSEVQQELVEQGFSTDVISDTMGVVDGIADGSITKLNQVDPTTLDNIEDAIIQVIASRAAEDLFSNNAELQDQINTLSKALKTMAGFGQANAQTSISSSLFGYQGYKLFSVSFGFLGSVATDSTSSAMNILSSSDPSKAIEKELESGGLEFGVAMQGFSANVGINMNWLIKNLYLGVVFGTTNTTVNQEGSRSKMLGVTIFDSSGVNTSGNNLNLDISMTTATFGITANYQLIKPFNIPILYRWNGISLGTGFIYSSFNVNANADLSSLFPSDSTNPTPANTFKATFDINSSSVTVPIEISTGIRLLSALNLSVGAGIDLKFGGSNVSFNIDSPNEDSLSTKLMVAALDEVLKKGSLSFPYSEDHGVDFFNPRVMAGLGIGLGPVTFDISANFYVLTGFTFGANFVLRI